MKYLKKAFEKAIKNSKGKFKLVTWGDEKETDCMSCGNDECMHVGIKRIMLKESMRCYVKKSGRNRK